MFTYKLILGLVLVVSASARYLVFEDLEGESYLVPNQAEDEQVLEGEPFYENAVQLASPRVRRQAQGSVTLNSDGSMGLGAKVPIVGNEKNVLSALGSVDLNDQLKPASRGMGLALDNVNGHGLSVMKETVPGFGDRLTGAGRVNVFHNDNHDISAKAFVTKNMPDFPNVPNFNTVGGGVDYMYKNKVGASLGMANTPFLDRKDYSAMGNLNVFRSPTTSVDFNAGFKKFDTPVFKSNWEPNFGLTFSRSFGNKW
uniref:Attacin-A n=1 Tax=Trichoplusia ni TaxID=7111 RepID=ATTA_TRINI|nr:RecName: Full=Attacin-A; Flags: Precursor [Trichoplusia ni]AAC47327.1 preproattacin A [Trichoplusia ni]